MMWAVLALIGFLVLIAVDVALGTRSTRLYEQAQQEETSAAPTPAPPAPQVARPARRVGRLPG